MQNIKPYEIEQLINTSLKDCIAKVESEDGRHFSAVVISPTFIGKNRIQKQQLVYSALGNLISNGIIHAISIKTFTPDEWDTQNKEF